MLSLLLALAVQASTDVFPPVDTLDGLSARAVVQGHSRDPLLGPIDATWTWTVRNPSIVQMFASTKSAVFTAPLANGQTYIVGNPGGAPDSMLMVVSGIGAACVPSATNFCPGDNYQAKIDAQPNGTAFTYGAGLYRTFRVSPKTGQTFTGPPFAGDAPTAVLDGGRVLTTWVQSGNYWYAANQTQDVVDMNNAECQTGFPACQLVEQLYVNNVQYKRELALADVGVGSTEWFFDHALDRIYVAQNPAGKEVITTVEPFAFGGTATNVTVKRLRIQYFAGSRPTAVVNANKRSGWDLDSLVADNNSGQVLAITGSAGDPGRMRWNKVFRSGQLAWWAQGTNSLIYGNEFAFNNTNGNGPGAGGEASGKMSFCIKCIVRNNYSHDNDGPGLWVDIDNDSVRVDSNRVINNAWRGIFYEISFNAIIEYNYVEGNGFDFPGTVGAFEGAGILVSNVPGALVRFNTVLNNNNGIMGREEDRGSGTLNGQSVPYNNRNFLVYGNCVRQSNGNRATGITDTDPTWDPYSATANNKWGAGNPPNRYQLSGGSDFRWAQNVDYTQAQWLAIPQDQGATFGSCP